MEPNYVSTSNDQDLVNAILKDKEVAFDFQKRKHPDWQENYRLDRDKVITNRITQRQSVNVPIMAETRKAWLAQVDEAPMIEFVPLDSKDNKEKRKAIYWNERWLSFYEKNDLDLLDSLDKKAVFFQGRSFKMLYLMNGEVCVRVVDAYDVKIDPKTSPFDIDTAKYCYVDNISYCLQDILNNEAYDEAGKNSLKMYLTQKNGIISGGNEEQKNAQQERLSAMGVTNFDDLAASNLMVEMTEGFKKIWDDELKKYVLHYVVMAANNAILYNKPALQAIGVDFITLESWSEDPDNNDYWPDSKADHVRPLNKVMNTWLSQLIENRTYRNFSMFFYDSSNPKYKPTSFDPRPFAMLPLPGKPADTLSPVPVGALTDSLTEMNYFKQMAEGVASITAAQKGQPDKGTDTLGELQIDLRQSTMITSSSAKFYRKSWERFATKWQKMDEANLSGTIELYKADHKGDLHKKTLAPYQMKSEAGFKVRAKMKSEVDEKNNNDMKRLIFVKNLFPDNPVAQKKVKEQALGLVGWNPSDIDAVMKAEESKNAVAQQLPAGGQPQGAGGIQPEIAAVMKQQQVQVQ